jgi:hypothetical protein
MKYFAYRILNLLSDRAVDCGFDFDPDFNFASDIATLCFLLHAANNARGVPNREEGMLSVKGQRIK